MLICHLSIPELRWRVVSYVLTAAFGLGLPVILRSNNGQTAAKRMSQFVNYNQSSIKPPVGCKDLGGLLRPKPPREAREATLATRQPVVKRDESVMKRDESVPGTLAQIGQHLAAVFEAGAQFFTLGIGLPDEEPFVALHRLQGEIVALVTFGQEVEQSMRAFFDRHGLQAPNESETPRSFHPDVPVQLVYPLSPLPAGASLLSELLVDLFKDFRGLDDNSALQFRYLEIAYAV